MNPSRLTIGPLLLGAAVLLGALTPLPAAAQYDDGYGNGYREDYQPSYKTYRPHCYYRNVRVYDDYYGRYIVRRQRVCDRPAY